MNWTAIVPLKRNGQTKSRMGATLGLRERLDLADIMAANVLDALRHADRIASIVILSEQEPGGKGIAWEADLGSGLNSELQRYRNRTCDRALVVVHGDLPILTARDIRMLCDHAEAHGGAIAPDRHGRGTNALALVPGQPMTFQFGAASFRSHLRQLGSADKTVVRPGLAYDVDLIEDFEFLHRLHDDDCCPDALAAMSKLWRSARRQKLLRARQRAASA